MAEKYSLFVMLHFQASKQESHKNEQIFSIYMLLDGPEVQQKSRHQATFSEPETERDFISSTCQQRQTAG